MTFAALLAARLTELGMQQATLARELTDRGIPTTRQAVNGWVTGDARPEAWKRVAIYDALAVPVADRPQWTDALLAKRDGSADGHGGSSPEVASTTS